MRETKKFSLNFNIKLICGGGLEADVGLSKQLQ